MAASLRVRRRHIPELDLLQANVEASELAVKRDDSAVYALLVHVFHRTIVAGSDNRNLAEHRRV